MKKLAAVLLAGLLSVCLLAGCAKEVVMDVEALATELRSGGTFKDDIIQIENDMANQTYGLEAADIVKQVVYASGGASAETITAIEAKDEETAKKISQSLQQYFDEQKETWESYGPGEAAKLGNAVLRTEGKYVIAVVSEDNDKVNEIIEKHLK